MINGVNAATVSRSQWKTQDWDLPRKEALHNMWTDHLIIISVGGAQVAGPKRNRFEVRGFDFWRGNYAVPKRFSFCLLFLF